jgi:hypothetical protein
LVDVSDPTAPREVGDLQDYYPFISDILVTVPPADPTRTLAYIATGVNFGAVVLDVSDPTQPEVFALVSGGGASSAIALQGEALFSADEFGGMRIVDVSNPMQPTGIGSYRTFGSASGVSISGNEAYVSDNLGQQWTLDISDPARPVGSEAAPSTDEGQDAVDLLAQAGVYAYYATNNGIRVVDVSDEQAPAEVGFLETPAAPKDMELVGEYGLVATYSGLQIVDLSKPTTPSVAGLYDVSGVAVDVAGQYAYVVDGSGGLYVLDIANPVSPTEVVVFGELEAALDVEAVGEFIYVADGGAGLVILQ